VNACTSRWFSYGGYPSWRAPQTVTLTPGCHCDRCVQLRLPWLWALAQAFAGVALAAEMKARVPQLCTGVHPLYAVPA
jgi:hypothetical protein